MVRLSDLSLETTGAEALTSPLPEQTLVVRLEAINIANEAALYNSLSTFSGTHWVPPRTFQVTMGFAF
jgi:hypothetical protein